MVRYTRLENQTNKHARKRGVSRMDQLVEQAYLYDFYGELLNAHQQKIYEDFIFHDLSLREIAEEEGISRQGVHDMVRRCTKTLEGYEAKLHLVQKFLRTKERVAKIHELTHTAYDCSKQSCGAVPIQAADPTAVREEQVRQTFHQVLREIEQISNQILEEL